MNNKKIMIIGGTGALGKTLLKRYSSNNTILIFSRDEHKHVNIQKGPLHNKNVHYIIGDVMSKIDYLNYEDLKEDRRRQKRVKKRKSLKEAKNKRRKKKYGRKDN